MTHTEINESNDGSIEVLENLTEDERNEKALNQLVKNIRGDPEATDSEKRLASALIALKESQK